MSDFPELTTIGALFGFALKLELAAADVSGRLADGGHGEAARIAKKHARRGEQVERSRKEKMNETVLEPLTAMDNSEFIPPLGDLAAEADAEALRAALLDLEARSAAFYDAAVDHAGPVLAEVKREFQRMAKDNRKFARTLEG